MTHNRLRSGLTVALAAAVAVGCARIPVLGDLGSAFAGNAEPGNQGSVSRSLPDSGNSDAGLLDFLASAKQGDSTIVTHPETGQRVLVTADRIYFAASGRYCRRYTLSPNGNSGPISSGIACKNDKHWTLRRMLTGNANASLSSQAAKP